MDLEPSRGIRPPAKASVTNFPSTARCSERVFGTMGMFRCTQVLVLVVLVAIAPLEASASSGARRMSVPAEEVALSQPASFASNWFHTMMPAIGNGTLLDLCLPGTHDSMTWVVCCIARRWCGCGLMVAHLVIRYDLSTTVADNANDLNPTIAWLLHELKDFADIGKFVREFVRSLSRTPFASSSRAAHCCRKRGLVAGEDARSEHHSTAGRWHSLHRLPYHLHRWPGLRLCLYVSCSTTSAAAYPLTMCGRGSDV